MDIPLLIAYSSIGSVLIPLSLAIIQWKKLPENVAPLRWLLVGCLLLELITMTMSALSLHNMVIGEVYLFFQFALILYILIRQFGRKPNLKIAYIIILIVYVVGWMIVKKYSVSPFTYNGLAGLVLIVATILFFYKLLHELKVTHIHRQPILWIAFATLLYYSGSLFVFLAYAYLINETDSFRHVWIIHNVLNFTKNILFAVALWQNYRTVKSLA